MDIRIVSLLGLSAALTPLFAFGKAGLIALDYAEGGEQPFEAIDFGPETVGGYAVFDVESFSPAPDGALPVVRLSYANHPDGLSPTGDFTREGHADYLHVDNPVLPANVNRHELYTVPRTGRFVAPLIQGQARYVRVGLDTPGASVRISTLDIVNAGVHSESPALGSFSSDDPRADAVWRMGVRTCQLASFPNPDAWRIVAGVLLPRKLERGSADGWCRYVPDFDGTLEVTYEFRLNPHFPEGSFKVFTGWLDAEPGVVETVRQSGPDGVVKTATIPLRPGRFGFRLEKEMWPVIHSVAVRDSGGALRWRDDFSASVQGRAANWAYTTAPAYLADGGKRDRLAWSGDIWWAQRTVYCAFGPDDPYVAGALRLFAFNQTPEGFCHAAPYAENDARPMSGDYGHFASDEFSAWLVPCAWDHFLHTGDAALAAELWPAVERDLAYLASRMGADGLFEPRFETSKHAFRMDCGDLRKRAYQNVLMWMCWRDGALLARALGHDARAASLEAAAARHAEAIRSNFKADADGRWNTVLGEKGEDGASCAMILASGFATPDEALALARRSRHTVGVGKWRALLMRGLFRYGFAQSALREIADGNWFALADPDWKGARCCTECLFLTKGGWWDESHPDTAISDAYTGYILGVRPMEPGFRVFSVAPQMTAAFARASGTVPTPFGEIAVSWRREGGALTMDFTVPEGAEAEVDCGPGKPPVRYGAGCHSIVRDVSPEELDDPSFVPEADAATGKGLRSFGYVASQPFADAGARYSHVFDLDRRMMVESLELVPSPSVEGLPGEIAVDGGERSGEFRPLARLSGVAASDPSKPLVIDLRTVLGAPEVRYLRISAAELPACRDDKGCRAFRCRDIRVNCLSAPQ